MRALYLNSLKYSIAFIVFLKVSDAFEKDMTFKVEAGSRTCFFEKGRAGQLMEAQYEVIDGHHGELDISFKVFTPNETVLIDDFKKKRNSIVREVAETGDFVFCFDNTFSRINPKSVFLYLLMESGDAEEDEAVVAVEGEREGEEEEVLEWRGVTESGEPYYVEVHNISRSLTRVLKHVARARYQLDAYAARKSRDTHVAFESTFVVDVWSAFQICVMLAVGTLQVYMVKQLFHNQPDQPYRPF